MLIVRGPGLDSAGWLPRSAIAGDRDLLDGTSTNWRRVQAVHPGSDAAFVLKDLPPGEYYLGAAIGASEGDWLDPAFLEALAAKSLKLSLAEGEHKTQELRIGG